ncbi:Hypothetical predicted protein [Cloeon dipterum]|uniref:Uncharacterized protein n=1 Tax=Cloeon dipterum TaxID=197152 RepID=A0A8S1DDT1_9INSE|nr:Hypothetical predicted protein [Cloeon dipterum]
MPTIVFLNDYILCILYRFPVGQDWIDLNWHLNSSLNRLFQHNEALRSAVPNSPSAKFTVGQDWIDLDWHLNSMLYHFMAVPTYRGVEICWIFGFYYP